MKPIPIAPRFYATDEGQIWDSEKGRFKKLTLTGVPAYLYTTIPLPNGEIKLMRVNRLVAMAYHPNSDNLPIVDHEDQDKMNNRPGNLRWTTHKGNQENTKVNVYVEYKGGRVLLIEAVRDMFKEKDPHYAYIHGRMTRKGEDFPAAVRANCVYRGIPIPPL